MKKILLLIAVTLSYFSFSQDTLDYSVLNKRMPLNLNETVIFLHNVAPYTGVALTKREDGSIEKINQFRSGKMSGDQLKYYPDGELKEKTPYANGYRNGFYKLYFKDGQMNSQMHFEAGILVDTSKIWYSNGDIRSLSVEDRENPARGYYISYHDNGEKDLEIVKGYQTSWYPTGKMKTSGMMKFGRPDGEFKKYNEKGKLATIEIWEDGKIVETIVKRKPKKKK